MIPGDGLLPVAAFDPQKLHDNEDVLHEMEQMIAKQSIHNISMEVLSKSLEENNNNKKQLQLIDNQMKVFSVIASAGYLKIIVKIGANEIAFLVARFCSIETAQLAIKSMANKIPILGTILAAGSSAIRLYNNEPIKALGEMISGALPWFGTYGRYGSAALDILMTIHDAQRLLRITNQEKGGEEELTLETSYKTLGIKIANPSKEQVDSAFQKIIKQLHPDHKMEIAQKLDAGTCNVLIHHVTDCKKFLYQKNGWS